MKRIPSAVLVFAWLLPLACVAVAEDPPDDNLASEFKKGMLVSLTHKGDSVECWLRTDAEHKQLKKKAAIHKTEGKPPGNSPLSGAYLILEVKQDRLVLLPETWIDQRRIRVVPLRYVSAVYRAGGYEEPTK